jgi:hypothetical protein
LPDLDLDTPNAYQVVGKFIARAIADEIMAPIYVMSRPGPQDSDAAAMAFAKARGLVSTPQGLARLSHVWGCNGGRSPVDELRSKVSLMLGEFLLTGDMEEAEECTRELHAKQFMHEVVFQAIDLAMDGRSERDMLLLSALLKSLCNSATISAVQLANGWARVILSIEDIQLDNPHAALNLDSFCRVSSFLPRLFCAKAAQLAHQKMVSPDAFVFCSPAPIAFALNLVLTGVCSCRTSQREDACGASLCPTLSRGRPSDTLCTPSQANSKQCNVLFLLFFKMVFGLSPRRGFQLESSVSIFKLYPKNRTLVAIAMYKSPPSTSGWVPGKIKSTRAAVLLVTIGSASSRIRAKSAPLFAPVCQNGGVCSTRTDGGSNCSRAGQRGWPGSFHGVDILATEH